MVQNNDDKVAHFQAVTGLEDTSLCVQILQAYGWDLDRAVNSMADGGAENLAFFDDGGQLDMNTDAGLGPDVGGASGEAERDRAALSAQLSAPADTNRHPTAVVQPAAPGMIWRVATLPFSVIRGSYNLMYGAFGLGMGIAGGVLSHSLGALGLGGTGNTQQRDEGSRPLLPMSPGAAEALAFIRNFESEYGDMHPAFQATSFMDALRRSREEYKFLFVYLHSPDHENTPLFCGRTLCSQSVVDFVNNNFVAWGGNVRASEGFRMSNSLKASTFPFCAVVMASSNQRVALLQQLEGPMSSADLVTALQKVIEEQGTVLVAARMDEEERQMNRRLREEQDAAYQAALHADQERERQRREEAERLASEAAAIEQKRKQEEEAAARAAQEAAEKEAAIQRRRQEKAMALGAEPEKGAAVTQVLVRFPNGERRERRFHSCATISSIYDYVDSLPDFDVKNYKLVSNFPRVVYGPDTFGTTLKDAGLHPRASLYIQVED